MSRFRQLMAANQGSKYPANSTVWEVTIPEGGASYQFFTRNQSSSTVVDWGDGSVETLSATGDKSPAHMYSAGSYTVSLTGKYGLVHLGSGNATYGKFVTGLVQVSEELTDYSNLCKHCAITELPTRFTIPYGVDTVSGMFESCKIPYLPDGFSLPETVIRMSRMFYAGGLKQIPDSFYLTNHVQQADNLFWAINTLSADVGKFFRAITNESELRNISAMFGATGIYGTAPLDKLTAIASLTATTNCFLNCTGLTNFATIPPAFGGGAVRLEDVHAETDSDINVSIAKINENYAAYSYLYDVKFTSANIPDGLSFNYVWNSHANSCEVVGTLPAGTYTFDVTLSNKWSSDTATITLIVDGGGSGSGGGLKVSGVMATMAAMITPAFSFADGNYSLLDASATGHNRVWKLENGGTAFYFRWSETELAWTLAETEEDPAMIGFPYIYSTVNGNDPWTSSGWEFSLTGPVSIEVTQA